MMRVRAAAFLLPAALLAGCGGSLSTTDAGTGTAGTGGAGTTGRGGEGGTVAPADAGAIPPDLRMQLQAAVSTWATAKGSCATYSYDRRWMSVFGGGGSTEVEVHGDTATRRRESIPSSSARDAGVARPDAPGWAIIWDEEGSEVGSHPTSGNVFAASTVEQLLAECATVLARDPVANMLSLVVDGHGVPTTCTYFPNGCADDCLVGIKIVSFACAPLAN